MTRLFMCAEINGAIIKSAFKVATDNGEGDSSANFGIDDSLVLLVSNVT